MKTKGTKESYAIFSDCERYRYELGRIWDETKPPLVWIGLNPSTADELELDPTLTRIQKRSIEFGAGGFVMLNLFAFRATNPQMMKRQTDPIGPENDAVIAKWSDHKIACCWGADGGYKGRGKAVLDRLMRDRAQLHFLELTKFGHPKHPLYVGYGTSIKEWNSENSFQEFQKANREEKP